MTDGKIITKTMALAAFALSPAHLLAEWRCDCTTVTASCAASVDAEAGWVTVRSNSEACSRVDYYIDGQPMVSTVVGGESREPWLSRGDDPQILVQSCQVCADRAGGSADEDGKTQAAPAEEQTTLQPVIQVEPAYPPRADGRTGRVSVNVSIAPDGSVSGVRVASATPRGMFDAAAVDAVRRWRYPPLPAGDERVRKATEQLTFAPPARSARRIDSADAAPFSDGRIESRNGCIKAGETHDLVDMLQVRLVNACDEPVLVYACAAGVGRESGKWVCDGAGQRFTALVRQGDGREGRAASLSTELNYLRYSFDSSRFIVHPAGEGYVWVGCALNDSDCHDAALAWQSMLQLKPSSIDPDRSGGIAVAASY